MFERFTQEARHAVVRAQEAARSLKHPHIGTEHLLLGVLADPENVASQVLGELEISSEAVTAGVEDVVAPGDDPPTGHIPFTPRAKKVMELSLREALQLGHDYIGTEHLLLGLVREGEGVAVEVLGRLGTDARTVRARLLDRLGVGDEEDVLPRRRRRRGATVPRCPSCRADLREGMTVTEIAVRTGTDHAPMRALFCRRCGRTITVLPGEGGGA